MAEGASELFVKPQVTLISPIFEQVLKVYGKDIIDGLNYDSHVFQANKSVGIMQWEKEWEQSGVYSDEVWNAKTLDHERDDKIYDHEFNCTNKLSPNGKYTELGEAVLMCTVSLLKKHPDAGSMNEGFMSQMYFQTAGRRSPDFLDMVHLVEEMGVTVIKSRTMLHISNTMVDYGGNAQDKLEHEWTNSNLNNISDWDELIERYTTYTDSGEYARGNTRKVGSQFRPHLEYLDTLQAALRGFLKGRVLKELQKLDGDVEDGAMFFVTFSLNTVGSSAHANVVRFMRMNNTIEAFVFEPHGNTGRSQETNDWYDAAPRFLQLVIISLRTSSLVHQVVIGNLSCPRLQKQLPLCAVYAMYFAVLNHVLPNFSVQSDYHAISELCNIEGSHYSKGSELAQRRTQILARNGQHVHSEHTCTHDLVIMMLLAFYGIGKRQLTIRMIHDDPDISQVEGETVQEREHRWEELLKPARQRENFVPRSDKSYISPNAIKHQRNSYFYL